MLPCLFYLDPPIMGIIGTYRFMNQGGEGEHIYANLTSVRLCKVVTSVVPLPRRPRMHLCCIQRVPYLILFGRRNALQKQSHAERPHLVRHAHDKL
jgi:hypothetical protein